MRRIQQRKQMKLPVKEAENKRKRCPESYVEEGFKTEEVISCFKRIRLRGQRG